MCTNPSTMEFKKKPYFVVKRSKLILMCILSWNLYEFYWFYKNWEVVDFNSEKDISPLFRTIFTVVTSYWLFKHFNKSASEIGLTQKLSCGILAIAYILILFAGYLHKYLEFLPILIFIVPVIANDFIFKLNEKEFSDFKISTKYNQANIALIIIGILLWSIGIYYSYFCTDSCSQ